MKKAFHLFLTVCLTVLVYVLYVPIIALTIASWPPRMLGWLLKSAAILGTRLQNGSRYYARLQAAYAYGCLTVADYEWKIAEEKRVKVAAARAATAAADAAVGVMNAAADALNAAASPTT